MQCLCQLAATVTVFLFPFPRATDHQETCARILLYRGANKDVKNNSGQTPFQVCWGGLGRREELRGAEVWGAGREAGSLGEREAGLAGVKAGGPGSWLET